jgi:hypothetical protein
MFKNPIVKKIAFALVVTVVGYFLLIGTFLLDFAFQSIVSFVLRLFIPADRLYTPWFPPTMHVTYALLIGIISWFILTSKANLLVKATWLMVPLAVLLATVGMFLNQWPGLVYFMGSLITFGTIYFIYRRKLSWLYYYAVLVAGGLLVLMLTGTDI